MLPVLVDRGDSEPLRTLLETKHFAEGERMLRAARAFCIELTGGLIHMEETGSYSMTLTLVQRVDRLLQGEAKVEAKRFPLEETLCDAPEALSDDPEALGEAPEAVGCAPAPEARLAQGQGWAQGEGSISSTLPGAARWAVQRAEVERTYEVNPAYGVTLCLLARCPIRMPRETCTLLVEKQSARSGQMSVPIVAMSAQLLRQAITNAVREDNFELASALRDELRRRGEA